MRGVTVVIAFALLVGVLPVAEAGKVVGRTLETDYVLGVGPAREVVPDCKTFVFGEVSPGLACYSVGLDERFVTVDVDDVTGRRVGGWYGFYVLGEKDVELTPFCGKAVARIPQGAWRMTVRLDPLVAGPTLCLPQTPGTPTIGTITAWFR